MSPGARHALRLGAYQLLFAGVAPHAAVGETVELVEAPASEGSSTRSCAGSPTIRRRRRRGRTTMRSRSAPGCRRGPSASSDALRRPRGGARRRGVRGAGAAVHPREHRTRVDVPSLEERLGAAGVAGDRGLRSIPDCLLLDGGAPTSLPGVRRGMVRGAGPGLGLRRSGARPAAGGAGRRRLRRPGGKALHVAALVGSGDGRRGADLAPGARRPDPAAGRPAGAAGRAVLVHDATATGAPAERVRPRAGGRAVQRDRLCAPPSRAAVAGAAGAAHGPRRAPGRDRRGRRRTCCGPADGSSTRCARSRVRRPTPCATCSYATGPTSSRSRRPGPTARSMRHRLWPHRDGSRRHVRRRVPARRRRRAGAARERRSRRVR